MTYDQFTLTITAIAGLISAIAQLIVAGRRPP